MHRPSLPPLNALRAFEAAARLGGFTAAAEELCVTPGAISQHIKTLEAWSGAPLFERRSQGVSLTSLGHQVAGDFHRAFDQIGDAVRGLRSTATPNDIRIATLPSIAQLWLLPRLPEIRRALPGTVISVTTIDRPPNLRREPFNLSVFFEDVSTPTNSLKICDETIFPVCAPDVAVRLASPKDMANESFLHDATWKDDWDRWLASVAPDLHLNTTGPVFSLFSLAVEEAKNGAGVLIGHEPLVSAHLASGALVAPFEFKLRPNRVLAIDLAAPNGSDETAVQVANEIIRSYSTV